MEDSQTRERIVVHDEGTAGPYLMVPVSQLKGVVDLLEKSRIVFWVDQDAISVDGEPEISVVNFGRGVDPKGIQRLLDNAA